MEFWDVYDREGRLTGRSKAREDAFDAGEYHIGVSLWIINRKGELLIQKRAHSKRICPGKWGITVGAVLAGETSTQGCIREAWEEIGLKVRERDVTLLSRRFGKENIYDDYVIIYDFPIETAVLCPEEVSEIRWATMQQIRTLYGAGNFMLGNVDELWQVQTYIDENLSR